VNNPTNQKRKGMLWLGLFAALAASGLLVILVSRRNPEAGSPPPPSRDLVQTKRDSTKPEDSVQPMKHTRREYTAIRTIELTPVTVQATDTTTGERGYEMPFLSTNRIPISTPETETDPVKLRVLLNSGTPSIEIKALRQLVQNGSEEAIAAALGKMLTLSVSTPSYDRYLAAFADCRSAAVTTWLTAFLGRTTTEEVRQRVLAILAAWHGPEVIESLAAQLTKTADLMHAEDCMSTLAKASNPAQAASLKVLLEAKESPEIQAMAACGLASVGNAEACAVLVENGSSAEAIAAACRDALATVDSSYGQEVLIQAAVNQEVPSAVRCSAVQALANQQSQRVQTVLINLGQATIDTALQTAISQALQLQSTKPSGTPPQFGGPAGNAGVNGEIWF